MINGFVITQAGLSHISKQQPCQDASSLKYDSSHTAAVGVIADGVGSCLCSREGAQIAVKTVGDHLLKNLEQQDFERTDDALIQLMKEAFSLANEQVLALSQEQQRCYIEYDSTLTAAVFLNDGRLIWGHIGDDGIVALKKDNSCSMITQRNKGDFEHSVIPLRFTEAHSFGIERDVASFAMMTDGVLDYAVDTLENDNMLHYPFFHCLLKVICKINAQMECLSKSWESLFNGGTENDIRRYISDDITVLMVSDSDTLQQMQQQENSDIWSFDAADEDDCSAIQQHKVVTGFRKHRHNKKHFRKHVIKEIGNEIQKQ